MDTFVTIGSLQLDGLHAALMLCVICLVAGGIWFDGRRRAELSDERRDLQLAERDIKRLYALEEGLRAELTTQRAVAEEAKLKLASLEGRRAEDEAKFAELAAGVLKQANTQFLQLANETFEKHKTGAKGDLEKLMEPIGESFQAFKKRVDDIEKTRAAERSAIGEQIRHISDDLQRNREATSKLVGALSAPRGAGRWGETTLRNVMEHAGLSEFCDFSEQVSDAVDEKTVRPDVIIRLPGGREIVVDSKVSLEDYLMAAEETDPKRRATHLQAHARKVRDHIKRLGSKAYQDAFSQRVDFVALFIPGENFYMAALEHEPDLFDFAASRQVVITTPSTLLALAKAVAYGWRQEKATENARRAAELGRELYDRLVTMGGHIERMGQSLNKTVENYNKMSRSLETRVLPGARKFQELGMGAPDKAVPEVAGLETRAALPDRSGELDFNTDAEALKAAE